MTDNQLNVATLDGFLQRWAQDRPDAQALGAPAGEGQNPGHLSRSLDYRQADEIVEELARLFLRQGLSHGDVVALQLANNVQSTLIVLALMRAGLVPCVLPMLWRGLELRQAFQKISVKAIICQSDYRGHQTGEMMCELAADHISVRFIYGIGGQVPDGVMALDAVFNSALDEPCLGHDPSLPDLSSNDPALMSWTQLPDGSWHPLWRTHSELILLGRLHQLTLGLNDQDRIVNPFPISSLAGLSSAFVPWLLAGACLVPHDPFDEEQFLADIGRREATYTLLPAPVLKDHLPLGRIREAAQSLKRIGVVWSSEAGYDKDDDDWQSIDQLGLTGFDILCLGDFASVVAQHMPDSGNGVLPLGPIKTIEDGLEDGPDHHALIETRLKGTMSKAANTDSPFEGRLLIRGPLVPIAAYALTSGAVDEKRGGLCEGWLDTGLAVVLVGDAMDSVRLIGDPQTVFAGGARTSLQELDQLFCGFEAFCDAAAFTISDPLVGTRLFAAVVPASDTPVTMQEFRTYLNDRNVAPYKFPEKLVVVPAIPRNDQGVVQRCDILCQIS